MTVAAIRMIAGNGASGADRLPLPEKALKYWTFPCRSHSFEPAAPSRPVDSFAPSLILRQGGKYLRGTHMWALERIGSAVVAAGLVGLMTGPATADALKQYPDMAPVAQYRMASPQAEIALARSAAPASISNDAEILVMGEHGFNVAVKGKNGFVCFVERSFDDSSFNDRQFWNADIRGPNCLNPAAARSVLPHILERTKWALSGVSKAGMMARTKAELAAHTYVMPEPGAMCFMMSKEQYVSDEGGHWHPHLMFYVANADAAAWGANLTGSPVMASSEAPDPVTIFMVPVKKWSDGTPDAMNMTMDTK
jgi:hypothetical protein